MELNGSSPYSTEATAAFLVAGKNGKTYTVFIPRKCGNAASSTHTTQRFRCNCACNMICGGICTHMRFICLQVLKMSEDQVHDLENGQELDDKYLQRVQIYPTVAPDSPDRTCDTAQNITRAPQDAHLYARTLHKPAQMRDHCATRPLSQLNVRQLSHAPRASLDATSHLRCGHVPTHPLQAPSFIAHPAHSTHTSPNSIRRPDTLRKCERYRPKRRDRLKGHDVHISSHAHILHAHLWAENIIRIAAGQHPHSRPLTMETRSCESTYFRTCDMYKLHTRIQQRTSHVHERLRVHAPTPTHTTFNQRAHAQESNADTQHQHKTHTPALVWTLNIAKPNRDCDIGTFIKSNRDCDIESLITPHRDCDIGIYIQDYRDCDIWLTTFAVHTAHVPHTHSNGIVHTA